MWPKQGDIDIDLKSGRDIDDGGQRIECGIGNAECGNQRDGRRMTENRRQRTDINEENTAFVTPDIFE